MNRRLLIFVSMIFMLALFLAACGGGSNTNTEGTEDTTNEGTEENETQNEVEEEPEESEDSDEVITLRLAENQPDDYPTRSEERRVGKECTYRRSRDTEKKRTKGRQ